LDSGAELAFGEGLRKGGVVGGAEERVGFVVPFETDPDDGVTEGVENGGVDGVTGREGSRCVGAGALVSEEPEVEVGEEASEVGGGEGFDP